MRSIFRYWDFITAVAAAIVAARFVEAKTPIKITGELITFFGIQAAIILPAMVFTAGILKPEGLRLEEAQRYHKALRQQMMFWITLLILDFIVVVFLILGKAVEWTLFTPSIGPIVPIDISWSLVLVATFAGVLAVIRTIPFVNGVLSLLDMNSKMVLGAIEDRLRQEAQKLELKAPAIDLPEGYGELKEK